MKDVIIETLIDCLKILPFLLVAFILIELFEHKFTEKNKEVIKKSGKYGPFIGSFLGLFPQCGFSVMATNLYVTRIITLGTLISVYLSTSDEMIPILISNKIPLSQIIQILLVKFIVGLIFGILIDFILRNKKTNKLFFQKETYDLCKEDNCHCDRGIFYSSVIHTIKIFLFILVSSFIINVLLYYFKEETLASLFLKNNILGPFVSSFIGLIPNCASSIISSELYSNNIISFGSFISALLSASGVALLVMFKTNRNLKENLYILSILYFISVLVGIVIEFIGALV